MPLIDLALPGGAARIEYAWHGPADTDAPLLVFLHEGLGSLSMWKDFPARLCAAGPYRGLVYSRPGFGASTPAAPREGWPIDFMDTEALVVLPALLDALGLADARPWLFGHSDGASIALIHAAAARTPLSGVIVLAPHVFVEAMSLTSIAAARDAYAGTALQRRLATYHADADAVFWAWNRVWLAPAFRDWDIRPRLASIACPVLAVQGEEDEYGTMAHLQAIAERVPGTRLLKLAQCRHSPHRDQPAALIAATTAFIKETTRCADPID